MLGPTLPLMCAGAYVHAHAYGMGKVIFLKNIHIVMTYIVMAHIVMTYIVMAHIVMTYIVMAHIVMTCI